MRWIIWYEDGTSFTDEDGAPESTPGWGVQAISQVSEDTGRYNECDADHYVWDLEHSIWLGVDHSGLLHYLALPGFKVVRHGTRVPDAVFQELMKKVEEDTRLPRRSAYKPYEVR